MYAHVHVGVYVYKYALKKNSKPFLISSKGRSKADKEF